MDTNKEGNGKVKEKKLQFQKKVNISSRTLIINKYQVAEQNLTEGSPCFIKLEELYY